DTRRGGVQRATLQQVSDSRRVSDTDRPRRWWPMAVSGTCRSLTPEAGVRGGRHLTAGARLPQAAAPLAPCSGAPPGSVLRQRRGFLPCFLGKLLEKGFIILPFGKFRTESGKGLAMNIKAEIRWALGAALAAAAVSGACAQDK